MINHCLCSLTRMKENMIRCEECFDYAHFLYMRCDIVKEDINKVALDRHILKGCDNALDYKKVITDLEKLHEFLYGAHLANTEAESAACFHRACHTVKDIIHDIQLNGRGLAA